MSEATVINLFTVVRMLVVGGILLVIPLVTRKGLLFGMMAFLVGSLIWIIAKYGQGGAHVETGSAEAPLTNGLADNERWVWGVFYVNRDDPSFMVEKRFGIGYTINFGNRYAVVLMVTFLVLTFGLTILGLIDAFS